MDEHSLLSSILPQPGQLNPEGSLRSLVEDHLNLGASHGGGSLHRPGQLQLARTTADLESYNLRFQALRNNSSKQSIGESIYGVTTCK